MYILYFHTLNFDNIYIGKKIQFLNSKLFDCDSQHKTEISDIDFKSLFGNLSLSSEYVKLSLKIIFMILINENVNLFYDSIFNLLYYINKYVLKYIKYKSPFTDFYNIDNDQEVDVLNYNKIKQFSIDNACVLISYISIIFMHYYKTTDEIKSHLLTEHIKNLELKEEIISWRLKELSDPFILALGNIDVSIVKNLLLNKYGLDNEFVKDFVKQLKLWLLECFIFTNINNYKNNKYLKTKDIDEFIEKNKLSKDDDLKKFNEHDKNFPYLVTYYLLLILRSRIYELICRLFIYKNQLKYCDEKFTNHLMVIINIFEFIKIFGPLDIPFIKEIFDISKKSYLHKYEKYKNKYLKLVNNQKDI